MIISRITLASALTIALGSAIAACPPGDSDGADAEVHLQLVAIDPITPQPIDLAICLDTSGSMQGLIDAARARIWDVVSDLATATPTPELRVALLTFGNDGHESENGWVQVDVNFTGDLDAVSERLFALTTNGGTELVGRVLDSAERQLQWTDHPEALRLVVVAGNESANQDQEIRFHDACRRLIERGVLVNSIYCGDPNHGDAPDWRQVALLADGHFAAIDHGQGAIAVATPYDDELVNLSAMLNETYLPFGASGESAWVNQSVQDANAVGLNEQAAAQRCVAKASALYNNSRWDLVDACADVEFKLDEVAEDDLPEAMQAMSVEERAAHVKAMSDRRTDLQSQIADLGTKRDSFVRTEQARLAAEGGKEDFASAIRRAVRAQAEARGFVFAASLPMPSPTEGADAVGSTENSGTSVDDALVDSGC